MIKTKHTPGEWKARHNGYYWEVRGERLLKPNISIMDFDLPGIDQCVGKETEANAKLQEWLKDAPVVYQNNFGNWSQKDKTGIFGQWNVQKAKLVQQEKLTATAVSERSDDGP